jgi:hypothetical protein
MASSRGSLCTYHSCCRTDKEYQLHFILGIIQPGSDASFMTVKIFQKYFSLTQLGK